MERNYDVVESGSRPVLIAGFGISSGELSDRPTGELTS
jgi:hypothetical protein